MKYVFKIYANHRGRTQALAAACLAVLAVLFGAVAAAAQTKAPLLERFMAETAPGELFAGADAYGAIRDDLPTAPLLAGGEVVGHAFVTSDFVGTTGYSGKPIHVLAAISPEAKLLGVKLVKHSEPIVRRADRKLRRAGPGGGGGGGRVGP
jgi:NosR/NirI family nitrous oxide reductase transcriptional regulator